MNSQLPLTQDQQNKNAADFDQQICSLFIKQTNVAEDSAKAPTYRNFLTAHTIHTRLRMGAYDESRKPSQEEQAFFTLKKYINGQLVFEGTTHELFLIMRDAFLWKLDNKEKVLALNINCNGTQMSISKVPPHLFVLLLIKSFPPEYKDAFPFVLSDQESAKWKTCDFKIICENPSTGFTGGLFVDLVQLVDLFGSIQIKFVY